MFILNFLSVPTIAIIVALYVHVFGNRDIPAITVGLMGGGVSSGDSQS